MEIILVAIITPVITATATLLGVWLTQRHESKKRESEEKRWYADYFLGRKIDALNNLYATLVDCHFTMNYYGNSPPTTLQEFRDKVIPKEEAYLRAKVIASIYLNNKEREIMSHTLGAFRQASMAIWLSLPDEECPAYKESYDNSIRRIDWTNFLQAYKEAVNCLEDLLNPEILQNIDIKR